MVKLATLIVFVAACGSTTGPNTVDATSLTIDSLAITPMTTMAKRGLSAPTHLTVTATLSNGTMKDVTDKVTFATSNAAVAVVTRDGVVTPKGSGTAMIMADLDNSSAQAT